MRAKPELPMLDGEDVTVEIGQPLLSFLRQLQVAHRIANVWLNRVPIEGWISFREVGGILYAESFVVTSFHKLPVQRGDLLQIPWIGKLPY